MIVIFKFPPGIGVLVLLCWNDYSSYT